MRTIILGFALVLAGCGAAGTGNHANAGNSANAGVTPPAETAATAVKEVTISSPDGVQLAGTFFESGKPKSPSLLLLHQWEDDRHSFDDFAKRMQAKGFNVLSIDGRGFGESVKTLDGKRVRPERTAEAVKGMLSDVDAAVDFLSKDKNTDSTKIGIIGASYGSSLALIYGADHSNIAAVALLSPGLNYLSGNLPTEPAIKKFGDRPLLLIAAQDDPDSADAVKKLIGVGNNIRYESTVYPSGGHGTSIFAYKGTRDGQPVLVDALERFFENGSGKPIERN